MRQAILAVGVGCLAAAGAAAQEPKPRATTGTAEGPILTNLIDSQRRTVGEARLEETPHGVLLKLNLKNATPGVHALHIHEQGRCDAPTFESAGGHFAPSGRDHGFLNADGPHAGDLPNIEVPSTTELTVEYLLEDLTLGGGPGSLLDADGSAIVIHAGPDDYKTEPAGDAGRRLACGRIAPPERR